MTAPGAGWKGGGGDLLAIFTDGKAAVTTAGVGAVIAQLGSVTSSERVEPLGPGGQEEGGEQEQPGLHGQSANTGLACHQPGSLYSSEYSSTTSTQSTTCHQYLF